jgi:hypothetical protein
LGVPFNVLNELRQKKEPWKFGTPEHRAVTLAKSEGKDVPRHAANHFKNDGRVLVKLPSNALRVHYENSLFLEKEEVEAQGGINKENNVGKIRSGEPDDVSQEPARLICGKGNGSPKRQRATVVC